MDDFLIYVGLKIADSKNIRLGAGDDLQLYHNKLEKDKILKGFTYPHQFLLKKYETKLNSIDNIFISHLHGDHYFGLPGLISHYNLKGRTKDLSIYGPIGLKKIISLIMKSSNSWTSYKLNIIELEPKDLTFIDNDKINKNGKKSKDEKSELKAREKFVLSISENGYGKKTSHTDYRVTNRGGKGIIGIVNSPRNGNITSSFPVFEGDEILISTNKGRVIRVAVKEIRTAGRNTQGVRIIKLSGEEKVVSAIKIDDNLI